MPSLMIDNKVVEVPDGATILDAARKLGIDIPTLCFLDSHPPITSCMVCLVRVNGDERLVPSCATKVRDGMQVESEVDEVRRARRAALELLLSDHLGDCLAPCQAACPAHMNIPLMIRQLAAGRPREAIATVREHIPLASVLGRICPAPCEKACRRGAKDAPVSICLLKRFAGDRDLAAGAPFLPRCEPPTGRKTAVIGAGPAGLSAAFYLRRQGHACTVFDERQEPGAMLRCADLKDRLPGNVLDDEIALIEKLGAEFRMNTRIDAVGDLRSDFDAVIIATGEPKEAETHLAGEEAAGVFVAGGARRTRLAVRAVADGRAAAIAAGRYLAASPAMEQDVKFSVHIGRVTSEEVGRFMGDADEAGRVEPAGGADAGFTSDEARREARRCLHCDCRAQDDCGLRKYAALYNAVPARYKGERRPFEQQSHPQNIIYEPGKCITCGLCIQIAKRAGEPLGLSFVGRGFDVRVAVPFGQPLEKGLREAAEECVRTCPTGALAFKADPEES